MAWQTDTGLASPADTSSRDTGSDYGQFDRAVSQAANNPPASQPSGGDGLIDPGFHPALATIQDQALKDALIASEDAAYGRGTITDTIYNEDGTFTYDQTPGIIDASKYQTPRCRPHIQKRVACSQVIRQHW